MLQLLLVLLIALLFLQSCNKKSDSLLGNLESDNNMGMKELFLLGLFVLVLYKLYQNYENFVENINLSPPSESCKLSCKENKCDLKNIPPGNPKEFCSTDYDCRDCMKPFVNDGDTENNFGQDNWHNWRKYV